MLPFQQSQNGDTGDGIADQRQSGVRTVSIFPGQFPFHFRPRSSSSPKVENVPQHQQLPEEEMLVGQGQGTIAPREVMLIALNPQAIHQRFQEMQINSNPPSPQIVDTQQGTEIIQMVYPTTPAEVSQIQFQQQQQEKIANTQPMQIHSSFQFQPSNQLQQQFVIKSEQTRLEEQDAVFDLVLDMQSQQETKNNQMDSALAMFAEVACQAANSAAASTTRQITEELAEIKQENIQSVNEEKTPEALTENAETSVRTNNPISGEIEIIVPKSEEDIIAEHDKNMENLKKPDLMSKYKFMKEGRTEITHHKFRTIFCSICQTQVPSLDKLAIHLDREHKIKVNERAPRVVVADECNEKKERDKISQILQTVENTPRTDEPPSDSDESSSSSSSDEDEPETENNFPTDPQDAYIEEKARGIRRLMLKEKKWIANIEKRLTDLEFTPTLRNSTQCHICYIEIPTNPKFRFAKRDHEKLHKDGLLLQCQYCNMSFNFEAELNQHLDGMRVPVVSEKISYAEMTDILYQEHHCPRTGCSKSFTSRKCLLFHRTGCTDNFKFHRCQICEKPFILHEDLKKHIQRSHNWEKRMIPCKVASCDKTFTTKRGWKTHVALVHKIDNQSTTVTEDHNLEGKSTQPNLVKNNNGERYTYWSKIGVRTKPKLKNYVGYYSGKKSITTTKSAESHSQAVAQKAAIADLFKLKPKKVAKFFQPNSKFGQSSMRKPNRSIFSTFQPIHTRRKISATTKSIPPSSNINVFGRFNNRRAQFGFPLLCSYCTRGFRTELWRDEHLELVHKVDLTLEKPFNCPVFDCDYATNRASYVIRHIRYSHEPHVEVELLQKGLQEDKIWQANNEENTENTEIIKEEQNSKSDEEKVEQKVPFIDEGNCETKTFKRRGRPITTGKGLSPEKRQRLQAQGLLPLNNRNSNEEIDEAISSTSTVSAPKKLAPPKPRLNKFSGSPLIQYLKKFKCGENSFYCPECPNDEAPKTYGYVQNVVRHMNNKHPDSELLAEDAARSFTFSNVQRKIPQSLLFGKKKKKRLGRPKFVQKVAATQRRRSSTASRSGHSLTKSELMNDIVKEAMANSEMREMITKFKVQYSGNLHFCPECPEKGKDRQLLKGEWSIMRHLLIMHYETSTRIPEEMKVKIRAQIAVWAENKRKRRLSEEIQERKIKEEKDSSSEEEFDPQAMEVDNIKEEDSCSEEELDPKTMEVDNVKEEEEEGFKKFEINLDLNTEEEVEDAEEEEEKEVLPPGNEPISVAPSYPQSILFSSNFSIGDYNIYEKLAEYKLPSGNFYCPACPPTSTGKIRSYTQLKNSVRHFRNAEHSKLSISKETTRKKRANVKGKDIDRDSHKKVQTSLAGTKIAININVEEINISENVENNPESVEKNNEEKQEIKIEPTEKPIPLPVNKAIKPKKLRIRRGDNLKISQQFGETGTLYATLSRYKYKDGTFFCPECANDEKRKYSMVASLMRHIKNCHEDSKYNAWAEALQIARGKVDGNQMPMNVNEEGATSEVDEKPDICNLKVECMFEEKESAPAPIAKTSFTTPRARRERSAAAFPKRYRDRSSDSEEEFDYSGRKTSPVRVSKLSVKMEKQENVEEDEEEKPLNFKCTIYNCNKAYSTFKALNMHLVWHRRRDSKGGGEAEARAKQIMDQREDNSEEEEEELDPNEILDQSEEELDPNEILDMSEEELNPADAEDDLLNLDPINHLIEPNPGKAIESVDSKQEELHEPNEIEVDKHEEIPNKEVTTDPKNEIQTPTTSNNVHQQKEKNIPRPLNSFMLFSCEFRSKIQKENPGKNTPDITRLLGQAWKALPEEQKLQYIAAGKKARDEHKIKYPDYKFICKKKRIVNEIGQTPKAPRKTGRRISVKVEGN